MDNNQERDKYIGKRLDGRYEILEHIGEGGMADVYRGRDVLTNKTVAVKILKKEFSESEEFLRRFRNESKAIAVLSHPNIVKIYDVGFSDSLQYIVMEYVDGITLRYYIDSEKILSWKDAIHFILQILRALAHAHSRGIVHRDIKPQNIMMLTDGTVKVMDFGIAKFARDQGQTATDQAIGTVHYISPEQARGEVTDARGDIYSVGVMLYEMVTGKKPFDNENPVSIAVMHMQAKAKRPKKLNPAIPYGLDEIIMKAMEKNPEDRYQSANEMIRDIEKVKENPNIVFGYKLKSCQNESIDDEDTGEIPIESSKPKKVVVRAYPVKGRVQSNHTQPSKKVSATAVRERAKPKYIEEETYEQEEGSKSLFVPVLMAVTIVVIIVAIFSVVILFHNVLSGDSINGQMKMENLVGMNYDEAEKNFPDLKFNIAETDYTTYEENVIYEQDIDAGETVKKGTTVNVGVSLGVKTVQIQDVTGWDYKQAQETLEGQGLKVEIRYATSKNIEKDNVIDTDPTAGTEVALNSNVIMTVSKGTPNGDVEVTNFVGMSIDKAEEQARYLGLEVEKESVDSTQPENEVVTQSIKAGEKAEAGDTIKFEYSSGKIPETTTEKKAMAYTLPIPENANGSFRLDFTYEGNVIASCNFNTSTTTGNTVSQNIEGQGSQNITVSLTNTATGATAQLGIYNFDFNNASLVAISEDISGAFAQVGGVS